MRDLKKRLVVLLLVAGACLSGCTMAETYSERNRRIENVVRIQSRMLVEDWDYLWLLDKPTYLNPHHVRTGLPN